MVLGVVADVWQDQALGLGLVIPKKHLLFSLVEVKVHRGAAFLVLVEGFLPAVGVFLV